jgi:hypothetical protein
MPLLALQYGRKGTFSEAANVTPKSLVSDFDGDWMRFVRDDTFNDPKSHARGDIESQGESAPKSATNAGSGSSQYEYTLEKDSHEIMRMPMNLLEKASASLE